MVDSSKPICSWWRTRQRIEQGFALWQLDIVGRVIQVSIGLCTAEIRLCVSSRAVYGKGRNVWSCRQYIERDDLMGHRLACKYWLRRSQGSGDKASGVNYCSKESRVQLYAHSKSQIQNERSITENEYYKSGS